MKNLNSEHKKFMQEAIDISIENSKSQNGGPFGCVIVKDNKIIARGANQVTTTNDPTAHAEIQAIRKACRTLNTFQLTDCDIYTSCEPCPMCISAIYWARPKNIYYANKKEDAAAIGFDDTFIYEEISKTNEDRKFKLLKIEDTNAIDAFINWKNSENKTEY